MARFAKVFFIVVSLSIAFPILATAVGVTFEHFFGQDGDQ